MLGALLIALGSAGCGDVVGVPIRAAAMTGVGIAEPGRAVVAGTGAGGAGSVAPIAAAGAPAGTTAVRRDFGAGGAASTSDVPMTSHCAPVADWPPTQVSAEDALYDAIEMRREATGGACGPGSGSLSPLRRAPELRCSARLHSLDMAARGYFDGTDPEGDGPGARMAAAGLIPNRWVEVIERGSDPTRVLDRMLQNDPGGCMSFGSSRFGAIGIGYGSGMWTLDFADR